MEPNESPADWQTGRSRIHRVSERPGDDADEIREAKFGENCHLINRNGLER